MTFDQYQNYKKYLSFEDDIKRARDNINVIPSQTTFGDSKVGYMTEELSEMKSELNEVLDKYLERVKQRKEAL